MMTTSMRCWAQVLSLLGGLLAFLNGGKASENLFSSDTILLAFPETSTAKNSWLSCFDKECSLSKRQSHENIYTHSRKVFNIYAKGRSSINDPIRYGDEVALFHKESSEGIGYWLSCEGGRKDCDLGTCPGLPHFQHWMWNSTSCYENRFIIGHIDLSSVDVKNPVQAGDEISLMKISNRNSPHGDVSIIEETKSYSILDKEDARKLGFSFLRSVTNRWIIKKDMIEKCGDLSYDARYKVCDRCGSRRYVRPKDEFWQCCDAKEPYNPTKSVCCRDSLTDLSSVGRDANEARCCGAVGYFPDLKMCCQGQVHHLPGQDTDVDDSTVQCCGNKPYLTTHDACNNDILTPLASPTKEAKASMVCKSNDLKCYNDGKHRGKQRQCQFKNNTYMSGERFSDPSPPSSCRSCECFSGTIVCDTVSSCPAFLPYGCVFYPANGECCPVFECLDKFRDNNHQLFLTRKSHVSVKTTIPELEAMTITVWMRTEQDSGGTLLSYATEKQPNELVITTHPNFRLTFKGSAGDEVDTHLNNGVWHFVCIKWKSSSGTWTLFVDDTSRASATITLGPKTRINGHGSLVLGKRQSSEGTPANEDVFVGSIAHFNVWNNQIDSVEQVKTDCLGNFEGNVIRWSVDTLDTHHSASFMKSDQCAGDIAQEETNELVTQEFIWEVPGTELERLNGDNCRQSSNYRIHGREHSFQLKVCPSATGGSLGNLHFSVLRGDNESPLYWPFPYPLRLSVMGNDAASRYERGGIERRKSKVWSLVTGRCPGTGGVQSAAAGTELNPTSYIWYDFITRNDAIANYNSEGNLRINVTVSTGGDGDWLYWNGHYYSHRNSNQENSWYVAESRCSAHGGGVHLTSIHSQAENDFVNSRSSNKQWIGLTDHDTRSFEWIDGSSYGGSEFTNWASNQPEQSGTRGNCGAMKPNGEWIDRPCDVRLVSSNTVIEQKSFTCKTTGKHISYKALPSVGPMTTPGNEAGVFSVDLLSSGGQTIKVSFFSGLHYTAPNMKFDNIADKIRYGAKLEFAHYVAMTTSQLGPLYNVEAPVSNGRDTTGVADLDGIVDRIKLPDYTAMNNVGNPAFSIEFWVRPRRMPRKSELMALFSKASSSSGSFSLDVTYRGSLKFTVSTSSIDSLEFATDSTNDDCKIKPVQFQHVAVSGNVGRSLVILVNGEPCYTMSESSSWRDVTALPGSTQAPFVFGEGSNPQDSTGPKRFNGQIAYIRLYDRERTQQQIQDSMNAPYADNENPVGSWHLRQSTEINLIHYVIADSSHVSQLKVLEDYGPAFSSFPVVATERNGNIQLFRVTKKDRIVVKEYRLNEDNSELVAASEDHGQVHLITGSKKPKRGCFTVVRDSARDHWIVITCKETKKAPVETIFFWKVFKLSTDGQMRQVTGETRRRRIRVAGTGGLDTFPSAAVVGDHLLLTAGTKANSETLFLDFTIGRLSHPVVTQARIVPTSVGPYVAQLGVTYYAYLYKPRIGDSTGLEQRFLRRVRPRNGEHSSSYSLRETLVNPTTLTANAIGDNVMPDNDWFWFLFRISTISGGNTIRSGQRIAMETPDNNPQNERKWSFVRCNGYTLQADQEKVVIWNFFIFKTKACDAENGGYTVERGDIGPHDCILLWPRTLQFGPNCFCKSIYALPTEQQIRGARQAFGWWFGPWRLMIPMEPTPVRPLPRPSSSTTPGTDSSRSPENVHEGNKYALLHYEEGINVPSHSNVRAALLRFARTTVAPVIVSNPRGTSSAKLLFRGNGGALPFAGAFQGDQEGALNTVYQEGSFAQRRMTSGLFYSVSYTPPYDMESSGEFKNLTRVTGLDHLEYPKPPENFVWLIPPSFKISGICQAVSNFFSFNSEAVTNTAPNSVASLIQVVTKATGPGSFDEGLFKPLLTIPIDVKLLHEIGQRTFSTIQRKFRSHIPKPPDDDSEGEARDGNTDSDSERRWQEVGEVEACISLAKNSFWEPKVQKQRMMDKLHQILSSDWMKEQMIAITARIAPEIFRNASMKYSSYGGIGVLLANELKSPEFLDKLLNGDILSINVAVKSYLPVLDMLRPALGIQARKEITTALLARIAGRKPWAVFKSSNDSGTQNETLREALDKLLEDSKYDVGETLLSLFKTIFGPLTSTQLGIFTQVLSVKKQNVLQEEAARAERFREDFLETFKSEHGEEIARAYPDTGLPDASSTLPAREWVENYKVRTDLLVNRENLLRKFQGEMWGKMESGLKSRLTPSSESYIGNVLRKSPKLFPKISNAFNVLGVVAATGSLIAELANDKSDLRQGKAPAIASAVATVVGAVGSTKGVYDALKPYFCQRCGTSAAAAEDAGIEMQPVNRVADEMPEFNTKVATKFRIDLTTEERSTSRLARYFEGSVKEITLESKIFLGLGVAADLAFVGLGINNIYHDFVDGNATTWKTVDDFLSTTTALAGAIVGVVTMFGIETGPAAPIVFAIGFIISIIEFIRGIVEARRERCRKWTEWCNWGKAFFLKYHFLINEDVDPCATCQAEKRVLLRELCLRGHISAAHRVALGQVLGPMGEVRSLAPSVGFLTQKMCPAWMRHLYKGRGEHKKRKGKARKWRDL